MGFTHQIRVRYSDCDMQGIVFYGNYFAFVGDAIDMWLLPALGDDYLTRFDCVIKKAALEWAAPARQHDVIELTPSVTRWGTTSFDVTVVLEVGDRLIGRAELTYISIVPGAGQPTPIPEDVRRALA